MNARTFVTGLGLGALATYLLDSARGGRRRALVRDKVVRARRAADDAVDTTVRDVGNRTRGVVAVLRSRLSRKDGGDDVVVAERVRAAMGTVVSHARSIDVSVSSGRVTLRGPILDQEVPRLLTRVGAVRGVQAVEDRLDKRESTGNEPGLQGSPRAPRAGGRMEWMQTHWSPSARLVAGAAGAGLALYGSARAGVTGAAAAAAGTVLLARAALNLELKRLFGVRAGRRAITLQKTLEVAAPVEQVFDLWSRYESFPRFMSHVREVQRLSDTRSRWQVSGPAGLPVTWETVETGRVPNRTIAWRTEFRPGDTVAHAGSVRFEPTPAGGTRLDIKMSYTPLGGVLGHGVAALLGADPRRSMDDDLVRFKSLLEDGKTTAHSHTVRREEIG